MSRTEPLTALPCFFCENLVRRFKLFRFRTENMSVVTRLVCLTCVMLAQQGRHPLQQKT